MNPAVTFGLLLGGKMTARDSVLYWASQLGGAVLAGFVCLGLFGHDAVAVGTPQLASGGVSWQQGVAIEMILTFLLVFVVYGTAVDSRGPNTVAGLCIGLTVTLDILCGGPYTGAAMNPARTFGPRSRQPVEGALGVLGGPDARRGTGGGGVQQRVPAQA